MNIAVYCDPELVSPSIGRTRHSPSAHHYNHHHLPEHPLSRPGVGGGANFEPDASLNIPRTKTQLRELDQSSSLNKRRVTINVCGQIFETSARNISRYPDTLLACPWKHEPYYDATRDELYFDRSREAFDCIFFLYQSGGKLLKPQNLTVEEFLEELRFYQMGESVIQKYMETYCSHLLHDEDADKLNRWRNSRGLKEKIWLLFDVPEICVLSRVIAGISVLMIVLSILVLCIESEFYFENNDACIINGTSGLSRGSPVNCSVSEEDALDKEIIPLRRQRTDTHLKSLFVIESVAMSWFMLEFLIRLFSCPSKTRFLSSALNLFDLFAVVPFFLTLLMDWTGHEPDVGQTKARPLSMLRITRLVRIFPILKLSRHSKNLQILGHTFRSSLNELALLIFFFSMSVVLFSSGVYIAEQDYVPLTEEDPPNRFESIPDGFWYAIITMSTVGYGDMIPQTALGKLVGSACALVGILTLSLPVPIIVSNFSHYYQTTTDSSAPADFGNIGDTLKRYSMMGPTIPVKNKPSSAARVA